MPVGELSVCSKQGKYATGSSLLLPSVPSLVLVRENLGESAWEWTESLVRVVIHNFHAKAVTRVDLTNAVIFFLPQGR